MRGLFIILVLMVAGVGLAGVAVMEPVRLGMLQETVLSVLHGGKVSEQEETFVDNCLLIEGQEGFRAIQRTRRRVFFRDGTMLEIVFSNKPVASNANC